MRDSSPRNSPLNTLFLEMGLNLEAGALRPLPGLFLLTILTLLFFSGILYQILLNIEYPRL